MTLYMLVFISAYTFTQATMWHSSMDKDHSATIAEYKKIEDCQNAQAVLQKGALPNTYFACVPVTREK